MRTSSTTRTATGSKVPSDNPEKSTNEVRAEISGLQKELEVTLRIKNLKQKYNQMATHINVLEKPAIIEE